MSGEERVRIALQSEGGVDDLLSLRNWLGGEPEMRGRVNLDSSLTSSRGELSGPAFEAIVVSLAPGVPIALAAILTSWIRNRTSKVTLRVQRGGETVIELDAARVQRLSAEELERLSQTLGNEFEGG